MQTPSPDQDVFTAERGFRLWRYGVGHSQLLLRSVPTGDQRCLDILFESVTWLSLPTSFDRLTVAPLAEPPAEVPPEAWSLSHGRRQLVLGLTASTVAGTVVCANVWAAYSSWTPTEPDAEADDPVWSLRSG